MHQNQFIKCFPIYKLQARVIELPTHMMPIQLEGKNSGKPTIDIT